MDARLITTSVGVELAALAPQAGRKTNLRMWSWRR